MSTLEQRVAQLEQEVAALQQSSQGEQLIPNYLTVSPSGAVGALFSGGVQMNEETAATYQPATALGWLDSAGGGEIREFILGALTAALHTLYVSSNADTLDLAAIELQTAVNGSAGDSAINAVANDSAGTPVDHAFVTILDSLQRSGFLQLGSTRFSEGGTGTLTWPGGSDQSNSLTVALPGASGAVAAVATPANNILGYGASGIIGAVPNGAGGVGFYAQSRDGGSPAATATLPFAYLMWGN